MCIFILSTTAIFSFVMEERLQIEDIVVPYVDAFSEILEERLSLKRKPIFLFF